MGQPSKAKLIFVVILFLLTTILVNSKPASHSVIKSDLLTQALKDIDDGWQQSKPVPLDERVINALALDDYIFQEYIKDDKLVSLYIGYYFTSAKIGAAHDPLVCFPGQGWRISDKGKGTITVESSRRMSISYSTMKVEQGLEKLLILYWFQAFDKSSANTLSQKLSSLQQKIMGKGEDTAFVRLSCRVDNNDIAECNDTLVEFAQALYPSLLNYVKGDQK